MPTRILWGLDSLRIWRTVGELAPSPIKYILMANKTGYDAPPIAREDDFLGRWRFATDIFRIAKETPPDWSVRLGVFAKWVEGKTTVLRFVEEMALSEGYVPVRFAPWSART